jgi:hypothetical protein
LIIFILSTANSFSFISVIAPAKMKYLPRGVGLGAVPFILEGDDVSESETIQPKV